MALPTIDDAFITKFNSDVHIAYQQMTSKFRGLVRTDADVNALTARFQKLGTVSAGTKARNGVIPPSNPEHTHVDVSLLDKYILMYVDKLDLGKLNINIRESYVMNAAAAFGRETDDIIIDAMDAGATQFLGTYSGNLTRNLSLQISRFFDINEVPDDGRRFCAVSPYGWAHLMTIEEFKSADYVGADLPYKAMGLSMKTWNRTNWFVSNRIPGSGTSQAKYLAWHPSAVGHAIGNEVETQWAWENDRYAWSVAGAMSMNATVIDVNGLLEVRVDDTAVLAS